MEIAKEKKDGILTVSISGALDIRTAPELKEALQGELEDVKEVIFDLGNSDYTSSAGLRVFLETYQILERKDGNMILRNVNKSFYDILKISGFTDFLDIETK